MPPFSSPHACWTCHLRKKKCGGGHPACSTCSQLKIECYGYGQKPEWMDGGAAEKEKTVEIRKGVKVTTDKLRRPRALQSLIKKTARSDAIQTQNQGDYTLDSFKESISVNNGRETEPHAILVHHLGGDTPIWEPDSDLKDILLMHYLDHVFPLRFPFYNPTIRQGGRGWILGLLKRTKPAHDAALSLAALHRQLILQDPNSENRDSRAYQQMYTIALHGLRKLIEVIRTKTPGVDGLEDSIEIFACIINLIMLEIIQGGTENWLKHLQIAPDLINFLRIYCKPEDAIKYLAIEESTLPPTPISTPPPQRGYHPDAMGPPASHHGLSIVNHASVHFFTAALVWLDTISAASIRQRPQYASICGAALSDWNSETQLREVMGCENWVMIAIRDIAVLDNWKVEMGRYGILNLLELVSKATVLEERLQVGIAQVSEEISHGGWSKNGSSPEMLKVTHAFAAGALVYLHVTLSGPAPGLPEISTSVQRTLAALMSLPTNLVRNAVWPLCIGACMAKPCEEDAWRDLVEDSGLTLPAEALGSAPTAWQVVETCWQMRKEEKAKGEGKFESDWVSAMKKMGHRVLFV